MFILNPINSIFQMKFMLFTFGIILSASLLGQGGLIKSTEKYKTIDKSSMSSAPPLFVTHQLENGDIVVLSRIGKQFSYFSFDRSLNLTADWNQKLLKEDFSPTEYLETNAGKFFLEKRYNKKEKTFELYGSEDNQRSFGNPKLLYSHGYNDKAQLIGVAPSQSNLVPLYDKEGVLEVSENKDYVGLINRLKAASKKENQQLQLVVMDSELAVAWDKQLTVEESDKNTILENYQMGGDGSLYILFRRSKVAKGASKYFIYVVGREKTKKVDLKLQSEVLNCQMVMLPNNSVLVFGYLSKSGKDIRKFFRLYDEDLQVSKNLVLEEKYNLRTILPKTVFNVFTDSRVQELRSINVAQYTNGSLQVLDQEFRYSREFGQITGLQLGSYLSYTLNDAFAVESVDEINRKTGNPTLVNAVVAEFIDDQLFLLFIDRRKTSNLLLSTFSQSGLVAGQPAEIDVKAVQNKFALESSFIYDDKLYLLSRSGSAQMTTGFQFHLINLK